MHGVTPPGIAGEQDPRPQPRPGRARALPVLVALAALAIPLARAAAAEPAAGPGGYPLTPPRVYQAPNLTAVAMPIGGIATGTIWLNGQGQLGVWQIANNLDESRVPDSFLALRVRPDGGEPTLRILQTVPDRGLAAFPSLTFEGGYPIARLDFTDPALPLTVRLEALNPMVPLDVDRSSLPCALLRVTARNTGPAPAEVTLAATLRNAHGDRNRALRTPQLTAVVGEKSEDPVGSGPVTVRGPDGLTVPGPTIRWLARVPALTADVVAALREAMDDGGVVLATGVEPPFLRAVADLRAARAALAPDAAVVFEDFEGDAYDGWTVTGDAFGKAPAHGTLAGQQEVCGFAGRGLVNTFLAQDGPQGTATSKAFRIAHRYIGMLVGGGRFANYATPDGDARLFTVFEDFESGTYDGWTLAGDAFGQAPAGGTLANQNPVTGFSGRFLANTYTAADVPQGTATSKPFRIERPYIAMLVGGGAYAGRTCANLLCDGQVVRTVTGRGTEHLAWASWDVKDLKGREATIQIVDADSGAWGHISVDRIVFADAPPGDTGVSLVVGGQVVRYATGRNLEELVPTVWDVANLQGQDATIRIADGESGGWGHINVDQIVFADVPPEAFLLRDTDRDRVAQALDLRFTAADTATLPAGATVTPAATAPAALRAVTTPAWPVTEFTRATGLQLPPGFTVAAATPAGEPLLVCGPLGKGRLALALAPGLSWAWGAALVTDLRGTAATPGQALTPGYPGWGSVSVALLEANGAALAQWADDATLAAFLRDPATAAAATTPAEVHAEPGQPLNAAVATTFRLAPGQTHTATFAITWHFPNVERFGHRGNAYCRRWPHAGAVAEYLAADLGPLWDTTVLYHDTVYESNLPEEFIDAMTSQSVIFRGPTCFRAEDGYFAGFEGCYGCCPLNCTHVWNYAQTHARLYPELGRNLRVSDFVTYLHEDGETSHRQHSVHSAFIDGHCACIEGALREYQMSPDRRFLEQVWPGVKKATDWMIAAYDADHDGVTAGQQLNTYDCAVSGANTFIGSQYLSALAAAERLALAMDDAESAARWRTVREAGMRNQNERLWNGQYYIQIPGTPPANDYNNGCHADQLLGQWWAHMLDLGYLYPPNRVRTALQSVMLHNFRTAFAGFRQSPRRYIPDDEGGLLMCTWPQNDRPNPFIIYADEVWTGIEYATAAAMVWEGMIEPARRIVTTARSRYDGRLRPGLDSGPGGNPFNELECGKFYARAMSSWGLLIASQGLVLEGPKGVLGFRPRWQPADHRSFFTAPEGWGLFVQRRADRRQTERLELRYGQLALRQLVFELPAGAEAAAATLTAGGQAVTASLQRTEADTRLSLAEPLTVKAGQTLEVTWTW